MLQGDRQVSSLYSRTRSYAVSFPSSRMESYFFAFTMVRGYREHSVPTFSCPGPSLTLFPLFQAKMLSSISREAQKLSLPSHDQPSWKAITSFHTRQRFITIPTLPSFPPPPCPLSPSLLWNEDVWLASDLLCPVYVTV